MSDSLPDKLDRAVQQLFEEGSVALHTPIGDITFKMIFETEVDRLTHLLEHDGYHIWFTCVVDDTEYRLAARTEDALHGPRLDTPSFTFPDA